MDAGHQVVRGGGEDAEQRDADGDADPPAGGDRAGGQGPAAMRAPARHGLTVVLRTLLGEARTAAELEWPASPEGRRGAMYPVAG
ncbi:hypothetical protein M2164_005644 [Streptomyces sp. SAI-208]|nr:hypothetical protein [Streptomyces sp. SAI-041]MDH6610009.1 hypothetical protein [Streptomyces sp. SAI-208]